MTENYKETGIQLFINGSCYEVNPTKVAIGTSLNSFIRNHAHLPGTKFMCLEGGCGACIVTASAKDPITNEYKYWAINSCLTPVYACDGLEITTIEGIGNRKDGYHGIQKRLAQFHGTQCGFCSPGMVMNMYALHQEYNGELMMEDIENSFGGNICRCTGYRPILDAFKSLAKDADPKYQTMCGDIEDIAVPVKICQKTGRNCTGNCHNGHNTNNHVFNGKKSIIFNNNKEWHKVTSIDEIFEILKKISNEKYSLIAGNTSHGVYRQDPDIKIFIDINNVEELREHKSNETEIILGANMSLTQAMNVFKESSKLKGFEYCEELRKHIDLIANVPVRNAGTLAGNLSIKHQYNEFPSDLFLILSTVKAQLIIASDSNTLDSMSLEEFLKTNMQNKIIKSIILRPLDSTKFKYRSYKIMPRAQNAHAYVNAGFLFELQDNIISSCTICYGGINPTFLHASKTEQYLIGKDPFITETLQSAIKILQTEITPDWIKPDASPEYRKNLAISLFYKFVLSICPTNKIKPELKSGGDILERPLSSGTQQFDTNKSRWPITEPIQKIESIIQCSGELQYINDIPFLPRQLWAAFVPAESKPKSKIMNINALEALKIPGVHYFFSAKDIPGVNNFSPLNMMQEVEEIFCSDIVKFYGQPLGIILADTLELANYAISFVKVDYKIQENVVMPTLKEAYQMKATDRFHDYSTKITPKNIGKNIKKTIKGHFELSGQYHFTMETQTTVCVPNEDCLDVYAATQWVDLTQAAISQCIKMPESSINLQVRRLGGAYGAKISRATHIACACAIGAKLTNRPVRFVLTLESNMNIIGKRFGVISDYDVSINEKGKIQTLTNTFYEDYGCSHNEDVMGATMAFFKNCYNGDTFNVDAKYVITDTPANTWCRAPGTTEGIAMMENIMEHIAYEAGLDPVDVRLENIPNDRKIKSLLPEFVESCSYKERKQEINDFNSKNRWKKRGIAIIPMQYSQDFFGSFPVMVSIYHTDGTVTITHGGIECGQGINTKVAQVAAHTLGVPVELVKIKPTVNYVTPNSGVTGGSMTSEAVCYATLKACEKLVERITPIKRKMKNNAKWHEITEKCFSEMIELSATHMFKMSDVKGYITWGLSCAEVEIDILTGNLMLRRVDILEDTGESMSPWVDVGQVEGAFIMGLGYWLNEKLIYDTETGELLTNRSWNYKPPGAKDIPVDFRIRFLQNSPNPLSVLRSKATGEPALCMSIVALFALRNALLAARKDNGIDNMWLELGAPTTPEEIFLAAQTKAEYYVL